MSHHRWKYDDAKRDSGTCLHCGTERNRIYHADTDRWVDATKPIGATEWVTGPSPCPVRTLTKSKGTLSDETKVREFLFDSLAARLRQADGVARYQDWRWDHEFPGFMEFKREGLVTPGRIVVEYDRPVTQMQDPTLVIGIYTEPDFDQPIGGPAIPFPLKVTETGTAVAERMFLALKPILDNPLAYKWDEDDEDADSDPNDD